MLLLKRVIGALNKGTNVAMNKKTNLLEARIADLFENSY